MECPLLNYEHKKSADLSHNSRTGLQQPQPTLWISLRCMHKLHLLIVCPLFSFRCCSSFGKIEQICLHSLQNAVQNYEKIQYVNSF